MSVLLRLAFSGAAPSPAPVLEPSLFGRISDDLSLTPRIATRIDRRSLERLAGVEEANRFRHRRQLSTAADVAYLELMRKLSSLCASHGIEIAFLKHGALLLAGTTKTGSREACDIDVLVSESRVAPLFDLLVAQGFRPSPSGLCDHQAPALHHPAFGTVEIHRFLPGVRRAATARFVRLEDLEVEGALSRGERQGVTSLALDLPALTAHLLSHGIAQHGDRPDTYPILRMFADLSDLAVFKPEAREARERAWAWCSADVPRHRFESVMETGLALENGVDLDSMGSNARRLLDHIIAGTFDSDYISMMRLALFKRPLSDAPGRARLRWLTWTILPGKGSTAVEKTADAPGLSRLLRNPVSRPFALAARLGCSLAAAYRVHRRGGRLAWG